MKLRILFVAQTPPPYHGQAIMQKNLLDQKWDWCEKVHVRMAFSTEIRQVGKFSLLKIFEILRILFRAHRFKKGMKYDALFYPPTGDSRMGFYRDVLLLPLLRKWADKTVFQFHASGFDRLWDSLNLIQRWVARKAYLHPDLVLVLSESSKASVAHLQPKCIEVLPNAIADVGVRKRRNKSVSEPLRILYVGALLRSKGLKELILAFKSIDDSIDVGLDVIGEYSDRDFEHEIDRIIRYLPEGRICNFHGRKVGQEKENLFRDADIFCFPTYYGLENQPVVILEAMMFGLPIVSTKWAGIPELIVHGHSGILVEPRNISELTNALNRLALNRSLRESMGDRARLEFEQKYDLNRHMQRTETIFKSSVLGSNMQANLENTA